MSHGDVMDALFERIRYLLRGDAQAVADAQTLIECVGSGHAQFSAGEIDRLAGRHGMMAMAVDRGGLSGSMAAE